MNRFKGEHSNIIKGPIGEGAPFKMFYNSDGTPNYVLSVRNQQQIANQKIPNNVSRLDSKMLDRGENHVSNYVKNLHSKISSIQQLKQEQNERLAKRQSLDAPSGIVSNFRIVRDTEINKSYIQKNTPKSPVRNGQFIKR